MFCGGVGVMATPASQFGRFEDRVPIDVFVVSSNSRLRDELQEKLGLPRWNVLHAAGGAEALKMLQNHAAEDGVLLLDPQLPDLDANEFHEIVRERFPNTQVMMVNAHTGQLLVGSASPTPVSRKLADAVNRNGSLRTAPIPLTVTENPRLVAEGRVKLRSMIGNSDPMLQIYRVTRMVAARDTTVLVTGQSGTGKDMVAQEIHLISPRRNQPFVVVNCSAIPEPLLEAELFGYTKGSFTGAVQSRIGRIHAAHGGTLFLDEIGDMPLSLQSKILRFLEQGEVQRLGGNDNLKVDVRVVAATNADLHGLVKQHLFREDLYYRLAIFPIKLPPLRERLGDVEKLAEAFLARFCPGVTLSAGAVEALRGHDWPGNVRELRNVVERASIFVGGEREILPHHILL